MTVTPLTGPSDLTSAWLTGALREAGHQGVHVRDVSLNETGTGQTGTSFRVNVRFAEETELPVIEAYRAADQVASI
jgi:hypothetical protein